MDSDAALAQVVAELRRSEAFALDTEFHRERTYFPRLGLVQVSWGSSVALIDPLAVDVSPLARAMSGDALVVAHAASQDIEVLGLACGAMPARLFDTQLASGFLGWSSPSLASLAGSLLKVEMTKGDRLTDWTTRPLDARQRHYAAADVAFLIKLKEELSSALSSLGRLEWALQECSLELYRRASIQRPETAWWRLRDARQMKGGHAAVAQSLAAWRERRAMAVDLPVRHVLSDLGLSALAQRPPRSRSELSSARGVGPLKAPVAAEVLDAIAAGLAMPEEAVLRPPHEDLAPKLRPAVALAAAWVAQLAKDLRIDASLLATRSDLQALLKGEPGSRLSQGWRAELVGGAVLSLSRGETAIAFTGEGGLVLEKRAASPEQAGPPRELSEGPPPVSRVELV